MSYRRWWIFQDKLNFGLFLGGGSTMALLVVNYFNERKLDHPVLHSAVHTLSQDPLVLQLLGFPVQYFNSFKNRVYLNDKIFHANILVKGPKGAMQVEIHAEAATQELIKKQELKDYTVADAALQVKVSDLRQKENILQGKAIDGQDKLWKITHLTADIGESQHQLVVLPNKERQEIQLEDYEQVFRSFQKSERSEGDLSPAEQEETRRFRQQQFYNQIRGVRFMQFGAAIFLGMFAFQYSKKNKRVPLKGTQAHNNVLFKVQNNDLVKKAFGEKLNIQITIRGAMFNNNYKFEQDFIYKGKLGTIFAEGEKKGDSWEIIKLEVRQKDKGGKGEEIKIV